MKKNIKFAIVYFKPEPDGSIGHSIINVEWSGKYAELINVFPTILHSHGIKTNSTDLYDAFWHGEKTWIQNINDELSSEFEDRVLVFVHNSISHLGVDTLSGIIDLIPTYVKLNKKRSKIEPERPRVFVSYSHNDNKFLKEIKTHFAPFLSQVNFWDDTNILPSNEWEKEIQNVLKDAKIAILLISANFLASKYISEFELPYILKRAEENTLKILIVLVRPCGFEEFPHLNKFQTINPGNAPLSKMKPDQRDQLYVDLIKHTKKLLENSR